MRELRQRAENEVREMLALIYGGSGSGKSQFAEQYAKKLHSRAKPCGKLLYVATMEPYGEEAKKRIARHQAQRQGLGFETREQYRRLDEVSAGGEDTVLLECLSNLAANELFAEEAGSIGRQATIEERAWEAKRRILEELDRLGRRCAHLVIVTADVFCDGIAYEQETECYRKLLADLNREVASQADEVIEVVCGLADYVYRGEQKG